MSAFFPKSCIIEFRIFMVLSMLLYFQLILRMCWTSAHQAIISMFYTFALNYFHGYLSIIFDSKTLKIQFNQMFNQEDAEIQSNIAQIEEDKFLDPDQKQFKIKTLKSSKSLQADTSFKTVTSLANTMVGSAIIVYPVLFIKDGMISSVLVMLVIGVVNFFTCRLLVVHNRKDEESFNESIKRIGGIKLDKLNSTVNMLLLFFVCFVYFLLVVQNFFQVTVSIIQSFKNFTPPKTTTITFEEYSFQWASIICLAFSTPLFFKKDIQFILKIFKFSVYSIGLYGIFIFVAFIRELSEGHINFSLYPHFDSDFSNVAGTFALSFLLHPVAAPVLKKNINLSNNERDLMFGYILTAFIYFFVGFIGGLTCASEVENIVNDPAQYTTIFDCVQAKSSAQQKIFYIFGKVVQGGILYQNVTVLPILFFLTRKELINLINRPQKKKLIFMVFTTFFIICLGLVAILAIDVSIILSFDGAIIGFFIIYGIPIYTHLKCYHHQYSAEQNLNRKTLLSNDDVAINEMELDSQISMELLKCNQHKRKSKRMHYLVYGCVSVFGLSLGAFKIYSFIKG